MDASETTTPGDPKRASFTRWAVIGAWFVLTLAAHVYVARYGSAIPFMDDMELASALLPGAELDWAWFWAPANEHRIVIPRFVYMLGLWTTGDFRSGMYFQVFAQALTALLLILAAWRLRGRPSLADAFFPLLLLHWGNSENFLLGMQITIAVPIALTAVFVATALRRPGAPGHGSAIVMVLCVLLLPLNGGFGLMQMPPLVAWMLGAAWFLRRSESPEERAAARVFGMGAAAAFALVAYYFVDFRFPAHTARTYEPWPILRTAVQFLSLNVGPMAERQRWLAPLGVLGFAALAAVVALVRWKQREERLRIAAVLAGLAAACTIAAAIGVSRSPTGTSAGLANRYVILPTTLWITAFLGLCVFGPRKLALAAQSFACLALAVVLLHDFCYGAWYGARHHGAATALEESIRAGFPYEDVVEQNWRAFYPDPYGFGARLLQLRQAGYPPFDDLAAGSSWPASDPWFMFRPRPRRVDAPEPAAPRRVPGGNALVLRADSTVELVPESGATRLTARFGLLPNAWKGAGPGEPHSDGLRFVVEAVTPGEAPRVLFERTLRPHAEADDRGMQSLDVELPRAAKLELFLRTQNVSGEHREFDFGFWADVRAQ
ncbi:MAG: hypothetical protein IPJ77_06725 [Planctomycetes bacterium]|nr:hypothetical protein [Planctomycetota bacterium]